MSAGQMDMLAAVRSIRERRRRQASQATAVGDRQGQLALLAAVAAGGEDPDAILGITDVDEDVVAELSHRWEDPR